MALLEVSIVNGCRLCFETPSLDDAAWNTPLFESQNFVAVPSLGSLVEGWLLLVPKKHLLCLGSLDAGLLSELNATKWSLCRRVEQTYGHASVFEHGPAAPNREVGCSVDHAHLHIVPVGFDLIEASSPFMPTDATWRPATMDDCHASFTMGQDYIYIEQPLGIGHIATHTRFGSQVIRQAIAHRLGLSDQSNWRKHPQLGVVLSTIATFTGRTIDLTSSRSNLEIGQ